MAEVIFSIDDMFSPQILAADKDFLLVYKPPFIHSAPIRNEARETLLDWCSARFPEIALLPGRKAGEGGLLHRLDYETQGLMLLARTEFGMETLLAQQTEEKITKEYSALAAPGEGKLPGFPDPSPAFPNDQNKAEKPFQIISAFRPYGPGRKSVRPVILEEMSSKDKGKKPYITEILKMDRQASKVSSFRLGIFKGFRHQIRCHLAWLGTPILNDRLYGGMDSGNVPLALRAVSLSFNVPGSGERVRFAIPDLEFLQNHSCHSW